MAFFRYSDSARGLPDGPQPRRYGVLTEISMRHIKPVFPLAAAFVLTLALVSGILFISDSAVYAADPEFVTGAGTRSVPENTPPGVNIGDPISATDDDETGDDAIEFGNTLTYSLSGEHAALFDIDSSTGQLITKAPLDAEATTTTFNVIVTVDDGEERASPVTQAVAITVTNVPNAETPLAPAPPTVVSGKDGGPIDSTEESTTSLHVVWHPPKKDGRPDPDSYTVAWKKTTDTTFSTGDNPATTDVTEVVAITDTTASITVLEADTSYQVRVQATNGDGAGAWSLVGTGSTNKSGNSPPQFPTTPPERDVQENTPAGENVEGPVTANDHDTITLSYQLGGPDADLFNFETRTGQIRTKAPLNHEDPRCYDDSTPTDTSCEFNVTVIVFDGVGGSDATGVTINVEDATEIPSAPARPTARATENSSTKLDVSWAPPENMGPGIVHYDVQYRTGSGSFANDNCRNATLADNCNAITGTKTTITGLLDDTTYEIVIRANNGEGDSLWSSPGSGRTNRANHDPMFDERPHTGTGSTRETTDPQFTVSRRIDENARSGQVVGTVRADDEDNDRLTYTLVAPNSGTDDSGKFTIDASTGQIRTKAGVTYDYEIAGDGTCAPLTDTLQIGSDKCYRLDVEVRDGLDDDRAEVEETDPDDIIAVRIAVRDRDEPPEVPTVTVTSPAGGTTLVVVWDAKNTGPDISGYDVEYRKGGEAFSDDNCVSTGTGNCSNITGTTTTTIVDLDEDTSYSVQVRATNDEGKSAFSRVETVKTNDDTNTPPTFTTSAPTLTVAENTLPGQNVGGPVVATDTENPTSLTYELEGRDAALFNIDRNTGQIRTKSALNTEAICDPNDSTGTGGHQENCNYKVRVKVDDGAGGSTANEVTINVTDVDEPPSKPSAPRVTATAGTGQSLDVSWNAPRDTGKPPINDYDIQYREFKSANPDAWELWPHGTSDNAGADNTATNAQITRRLPAADAEPLKPRTQYEVRVRPKNGEEGDTDNWSREAKATTGPSNSRPSFDRTDSPLPLRVDENTGPNQNVGSAVSASDADSNSLRYSLEGPGKDSFTIVSSSGQIRTKSPLDFETRQSYSVTVKVDDGQKKTNSIAAKSVTITVDNVIEQPSAPAAPRVSGIPSSTDSVRVTWDAPANTGTAITQYEVHYREVGSGLGFGRWTHFGIDRSTIITGLRAGTNYEVQVRARSTEGTSDWSSSGRGMPNPDIANRNPEFSAGTRSLNVPENTVPNTDVGDPVAAIDRDGDSLTYTLEGADRDSFDILSTTDGGQIRTSASLNYEEKSSYSVTMRVSDGRGGSDAVSLTINVTDEDGEAPDTPYAPSVTAVSSTRLQVNWTAPSNDGPPITDYDYRYREPGDAWTEVTNTSITGTTIVITGLAASTSYDVEVLAKNAEGSSDWSNPGIGSTNAAGANNPPVFTEGLTTTRSVAAGAAAGTNIGAPVSATDADAGEVVSYSIEGRDAGLFEIVTATGQLQTKSGITLITDEDYTVIVVANDGTDTARINVTITATAAAPNDPPEFQDGATTTRSVADNVAAGSNIGAPVAATDPGDTLTYTLGGTDAASFNIVAATGQLQTRAALDASVKSSYTVTVTATDTAGGTDTITVTITVTAGSSLGELGDRYDANGNGAIERSEVITAIQDYFADVISRDDVIEIIRLYFSS